jgi:hypothetical protein
MTLLIENSLTLAQLIKEKKAVGASLTINIHFVGVENV